MNRRVPARELLRQICRQLDEQDARAASRHEIVLRELEESKARDERIRREYAELESVASAKDRFARSEKIFVGAMSEINISIQRNIERLDDMADAIRANTRAVLRVLDRLEPRSG